MHTGLNLKAPRHESLARDEDKRGDERIPKNVPFLWARGIKKTKNCFNAFLAKIHVNTKGVTRTGVTRQTCYHL